MVTVMVNHVRPAVVWIYCRGREVCCDVDRVSGDAFCPSCGRTFKVTW